MISRPELAHVQIGEVRVINGQPMRHLGGGRFLPASIDLAKRFDVNEFEPLHRRAVA